MDNFVEYLLYAANNPHNSTDYHYMQNIPNTNIFITATVRGPVDTYGQHHGICTVFYENIEAVMYFNNGCACFNKCVLIKKPDRLYHGFINNYFSYHGMGILTFLQSSNCSPNSIFSINGHFETGNIDCTKEVEIHYLNGDVYVGYVDILLRRHGKGIMLYFNSNIVSIEGLFKHGCRDYTVQYKVTYK
jgi:hypothetical protein